MGQHHRMRIGGAGLERPPLKAQAVMRSGLRKLLIFQPLPNLCDLGERAVQGETGKSPASGPLHVDPGYIRPVWVTTTASLMGVAFS